MAEAMSLNRRLKIAAAFMRTTSFAFGRNGIRCCVPQADQMIVTNMIIANRAANGGYAAGFSCPFGNSAVATKNTLKPTNEVTMAPAVVKNIRNATSAERSLKSSDISAPSAMCGT